MSDLVTEIRARHYSVVPSLLSPNEVAALNVEAERLWHSQQPLSAFNLRIGTRQSSSGQDVLERLDPVADISELYAKLNTDPRLVNLASAILGEPAVAMKEKLIFKWPGTHGYGVHRDDRYFAASGASGAEIISISIALEAASAENGAIVLYPQLRNQPLAAPLDEPRDIDTQQLLDEPKVMPELAAGDALLFDGLVPHCSAPNTSTRSRRTHMITFVPSRYATARQQYYEGRTQELAVERSLDQPGNYYL